MATSQLFGFVAGAFDALRFPQVLTFLLTSKTIRDRSVKCFFLNVVVIWLGKLCATYVMSPMLRFLFMYEASPDLAAMGEAVDTGFMTLYQLLFVVPNLALSSILSLVWYAEIADAAYRFLRKAERSKELSPSNQARHMRRTGRARGSQETTAAGGTIGGGGGGSSSSSKTKKTPRGFSVQAWLTRVSEMIYWVLLSYAILFQSIVVGQVPVIGWLLSCFLLSFYYSMYCLDYRWSLEGVSLEARMRYMETQWAYFFGFGFPLAITTFIFPAFLSEGIYSLCFPAFVLLAMVAEPNREALQRKNTLAIPVFLPASLLATLAIKLLKSCMRGSREAGGGKVAEVTEQAEEG